MKKGIIAALSATLLLTACGQTGTAGESSHDAASPVSPESGSVITDSTGIADSTDIADSNDIADSTEADVVISPTEEYIQRETAEDEPYNTDSIDEAETDPEQEITGEDTGDVQESEANAEYGAPPQVYDIPGITYMTDPNTGVTILIANKSYALPYDFNPGLDPTCEAQFAKLSAGAAADGLDIYLSSGFRSYDYQSEIYNNYCYWYGQESADTFSARPGHSEHQSGLAIDVNIIDDSFIGTPEAIWLEEHCWEYGFILRYPQSKQDITGYKYESWHIRYVGTEVSCALHELQVNGDDPYLTLEEYLGIDSYYH